MVKRTQREIEKDLAIIRVAAGIAKNWSELAQLSGLTPTKLNTSLASHPIIKNRIAEQLRLNKENENEKAKTSAETSEEISATQVSNRTTVTQVSTSEEKSITIVETSALMFSLPDCMATPVVAPRFVVSELEKLASDNKEASNALIAIQSTKNWLTFAPNLYTNEVLLEEPDFIVKRRSRGIVALACYYWSEGYTNITIKTRSSEVTKLASLQKIGIVVNFLQSTSSNTLRIVS